MERDSDVPSTYYVASNNGIDLKDKLAEYLGVESLEKAEIEIITYNGPITITEDTVLGPH